MNNKNLILIGFFLIGLSSCYEVTEGDLYETYEPKIIIEAQINNQSPPYFVKVSYSASPYDTVDFYPVSNAVVYFSDNNDNSEFLTRISTNTYASYNLQGVPDNQYYLNVFLDGKEYEAQEIMPKPANIYKTEVRYISQYVPEAGYYIKLFIDKQVNTRFYKLDVKRNDSLYNDYSDLIIFDDAYADDTVEYLVPYAFELNDTVNIDLHVIPENIYRYYYALKKQTTNSFSNIQTPLKNPPANIDNQSLGFFQVSAITRVNLIIKEPFKLIESTTPGQAHEVSDD